jgi:hypothetical protein
MAKNVDDLVIKVSTEGAASLDQLNAKLGSIDKSSQATSESLKQFNIRNVAYQVQDLSVQLAMGTSAFVALGQQLPQLLSGFGVMGAVIGAVAAVGIPLFQMGLKAAGVDMRNLNEMIKDLNTSTTAYLEAQKQNQNSLSGLANAYGSLTPLAKDFFEVQERLTKSKATRDASDAVKELKDSYSALSKEAIDAMRSQQRFVPQATGSAELGMAWKRAAKGLTEQQGYDIAKLMKDIDAASPEKSVAAINSILNYLDKAGPSANNFKQSFEKSVEPLMKINEELIKQQTNIRAAAEQASNFNAAMMNLSTPAQADINAAKRNFDQITAIKKEGDLKYAEFKANIDHKTELDGAAREKELTAFRLKNNQEVNDKVADFVKSQNEAYRSSVLQNTTKKDQLSLQEKILGLSENGRLSAFNTLQLETDLLTNANSYQEALRGIAEQRRKNIIDTAMQTKLEKDAAAIKEQSDQNSYTAAERRQKSLLEAQQQIINSDASRNLLIRQTAELSDREARNAEAIFNINEERKKQILGLQQLDNPELKAAKEKEINDIYDARVISLKRQQDINLEIQQSFTGGWNKAFNNYVDNANNAVNRAQTIFSAFTTGMEDALFRLFKTGKLGWKSFVQDMVDTLLKSQIKQLMANVMTAGGNGNVFSSVGKMMGFADGGLIPTNSPVIVGERGPEIISGAAGRTVTPNNALGGTVTYNINAVDAQSFKQMLAADPTFLHAVAEQGRRRLPGAR